MPDLLSPPQGSTGACIQHGRAQSDVGYALSEGAINGTSVVSLMTLAGEHLAAQGSIAVISSVAGARASEQLHVRQRQGPGEPFASGQRQRLRKAGVNVMTIKPGFVDTPMMASFKKGALWAKPEKVASDIIAGLDKGRAVVYTPGLWRLTMLIIKLILGVVFVRLAL